MTHPRYTERTVEWGNWGILFMDVQPDTTKNFGVIVGNVYFPIGTRGPCATTDPKYKKMCADWIDHGVVPDGISYYHAEKEA